MKDCVSYTFDDFIDKTIDFYLSHDGGVAFLPLNEIDHVTQTLGLSYVCKYGCSSKNREMLRFRVIDKNKFFLAKIKYGI